MDSVNPIKFDIKAEESDFNCFIEAVAEAEGITKTGYTPSTDKSHFTIYKFVCDKEKCAVVYDLKAKKISLTAKPDVLERFKTLYLKRDFLKLQRDNKGQTIYSSVPSIAVQSKAPAPAQSKSIVSPPSKSLASKPAAAIQSPKTRTVIGQPKATQAKPVDLNRKSETKPSDEAPSVLQSNVRLGSAQAKPSANAQQPKSQAAVSLPKNNQTAVKPQSKVKKPVPQSQTTANTAASNVAAVIKPDKKAKAAVPKSGAPVKTEKQENAASNPPMEYKDGYAIKKYSLKRLEEALKAVKALSGTSYKAEPASAVGRQDETLTYVISGREGQKVTLRYMPQKLILQLQGKRSNLFSEVQVLISKDTDFKSAVSSHIELTGESTSVGNMQRRLKKILPHAFDYLDEQSKIDLTIGLIDINNNETRLSDYSSLLTPPYRGLEKFISDLQRAQGIEVKMIGQGYEKDDEGNYRLKSGYRKRIDSIVYNEVMSALYTEYFSRRNFYSHSDNTDSNAPRIITDKQEVKNIFNNLIEVINYNSKKLKEIGFSVR